MKPRLAWLKYGPMCSENCFSLNWVGILLIRRCFLALFIPSLALAPIMQADYFPVNSSFLFIFCVFKSLNEFVEYTRKGPAYM